MKKQLKDGLILRSLSEGVTSDRENLGQFYMDVFGDNGDEDSPAIEVWTTDLLDDAHPAMSLDDFWVVVDPAEEEKIVSAVLLIPQMWTYEDVELGVGRIELVATHKDYRQRGLVRALIDAAHERSAALGHAMQGITGIPHYYRRFGYAMGGLDLGRRATLPMTAVPKLKDDEAAKYTLRPATVADIPDLIRWDTYRAESVLLHCPYTEVMWRYEIEGRSDDTPQRKDVKVILNRDDESVGYVVMSTNNYFSVLNCLDYVVGDETSYLDTFDDVVRDLKAHAQAFYADHKLDVPEIIGFASAMPDVVKTLVDKTGIGQAYDKLYAWYLRVPEMPSFIRTVAPVLERRLRGSGAHCYTGDLKIHFFDTTALTITFERGKIVETSQGTLLPEWEADAAFPNHSFLSVLFGHRTPGELERIMPEVFVNRKAAVLLEALFPQKCSSVMAFA
jgi:GNAT superfamily N-acetyltransferase